MVLEHWPPMQLSTVLPSMINAFHLVAMIFAFGRVIELFGIDSIMLPLRRSFPSYLWSCPRCISVWAGTIVVPLFYFYPWANWPLALSWLYIAWIDRKQAKNGRFLRVTVKEGKLHWNNQLNASELMALFNAITIKTEPSEEKVSESAQSSI